MPFVRYARDRRGYETLYVMHAFDEAGRGRPRVLYACRTVPYAKFGRVTLDDSVQRRLESAYPALAFDWPKLLKEAAQAAPRPAPTNDRAEGRGQRAKGREGRGQREKKDARPPREQRPPRPQPPAKPPVQDVAPEIDNETIAALEPITELIEWPAAAEPENQTSEPVEPVEPFEPGPLEIHPSWPSVNVLGSEKTLIYRGRFIELAHRVMNRVEDPSSRNRLLGLVVRLNPEGWKSDDEARASAAAFESVYEQVTRQLRR